MAGTSPAKGAQNPKRRRSRGAGSRANAGVTAAPTLAAGAAAILATAEPTAKIAASRALAEVWAKGAIHLGGLATTSCVHETAMSAARAGGPATDGPWQEN